MTIKGTQKEILDLVRYCEWMRLMANCENCYFKSEDQCFGIEDLVKLEICEEDDGDLQTDIH